MADPLLSTFHSLFCLILRNISIQGHIVIKFPVSDQVSSDFRTSLRKSVRMLLSTSNRKSDLKRA